MITKVYYSSYFFLGLLACIFAYVGLFETAITFRSISIIIIFILYYQIKQIKEILFYLGLIFHMIAESLMIFDMQNYFSQINICFILYGWILIFLLRNNTKNIKLGIDKNQIIPFLISSLLVVYLTIEVWNIVNVKFKDALIYSYIYLATFLFLLIYIGSLYICQYRNNRYILLLLFLISIVSTTVLGAITVLGPTESIFFDNKVLSKIVFFIQIVSHFFLFKFLISKDEEVSDFIDEY